MIGILTYNVPHRKTYDLLSLLTARGYKDVNVYAVPMHYKKTFQPLYQHRPPVRDYMDEPKVLCEKLGVNYFEGQLTDFDIPSDEILLISGAGIIPEDFIKSHTIINAHPGYIPYARGLDAFKWAILEDLPIGVSVHLLGDYVDAGEVIERRTREIAAGDTFHSLALWVYETEVGMLIDAIEKLDAPREMIIPDEEKYPVHRRMSHENEIEMMQHLTEKISNLAKNELADS